MGRTGVTAAVGTLLVAIDENIAGGFTLSVVTAEVGAFGFVAVVKQCAREFDQQAVVEVKAQFLQ